MGLGPYHYSVSIFILGAHRTYLFYLTIGVYQTDAPTQKSSSPGPEQGAPLSTIPGFDDNFYSPLQNFYLVGQMSGRAVTSDKTGCAQPSVENINIYLQPHILLTNYENL